MAIICSKCKRSIDTTVGYLVMGNDLQFTSAPDPQLQDYEEATHFVCPREAEDYFPDSAQEALEHGPR